MCKCFLFLDGCVFDLSLCDSSDARTTSLDASATAVPLVSMATPTADHVTATMPAQRAKFAIPTPDAACARWASHSDACVSYGTLKCTLLEVTAED